MRIEEADQCHNYIGAVNKLWNMRCAANVLRSGDNRTSCVFHPCSTPALPESNLYNAVEPECQLFARVPRIVIRHVCVCALCNDEKTAIGNLDTIR
jgi:hypothetical protein